MIPIQKMIAAVGLCLCPLVSATADNTIALPPDGKTSFTLTAPDGWRLSPEEGHPHFWKLSAPAAPTLHLAIIDGNLDEVIEKRSGELGQQYNEFKLEPFKGEGDVREAQAKAKMKDDNDPVVIRITWAALPGGKVAERWYDIEVGEELGVDTVQKVSDSFAVK